MGAQKGAGGIRVEAPAKLNLYLHVLGKRRDGYHLLDSLIVFTDLYDVITVSPSDALNLYLEGPFSTRMPGQDDNLVLRAARLLAAATGVDPKADILLTKNIPVAAGLGGGSADAAAALVALQRLWNVSLAPERLSELALALGADVPVCLYGNSAFVGGIGEAISPAPALPPVGCVLVNPGVPVSTADVFRGRSGAYSEPARLSGVPGDAASLAASLAGSRNDLTESAIAHAPAISAILETLEADPTCLLARLSGSGPTCFGLYANAAAARRAADRLPANGEGWWRHAGLIPRGSAVPSS